MKKVKLVELIKGEIQRHKYLKEQTSLIYGCTDPDASNYYSNPSGGCDGSGQESTAGGDSIPGGVGCCLYLEQSYIDNMTNKYANSGCKFLCNRSQNIESKHGKITIPWSPNSNVSSINSSNNRSGNPTPTQPLWWMKIISKKYFLDSLISQHSCTC
tara:strand:- start:93 stop:563 length:471 start_codon:yes stop_codon:yes gene_type:complete